MYVLLVGVETGALLGLLLIIAWILLALFMSVVILVALELLKREGEV